MCTVLELQETLKRFGGTLKKGSHTADAGECCALELEAACHNWEFTDNPDTVRMFDLRSLNDIDVPDDLRTQLMLPVIAAYAGSLDWEIGKQLQVTSKLAILVTNRLVSELPGLPLEIRKACRDANNLDQATCAATCAATYAATHAAAWTVRAGVGYAASYAASYAARAMRDARDAHAAICAARAAARAARAAARAADAYADAYAGAGSSTVFQTACQIWLEAASA